ncbi:MAG: Mrp/NBP35 family ATP-binding protein [Alkalispirochaetaceae bacterium]
MIQGKPNPQDERLKARMERVKYKIVVMSGKGGVGKSTVAVNLAYALALRDLHVGVLDADIHGPNLGKMLGVETARFTGSEEEIDPVEVLPTLKAASVAMIGYDPDAALIWRGPMKLGIIKQFLGDIVWGDLDYLIIDTPPGTGDEVLTIGQYLPELTGCIIVTTPQDVAILDSRKSVDFARKMNLPILGIVENMRDSDALAVFGSGGGEKAAEELDVPFLGSVPLEASLVASGDAGMPYIAASPDAPAAKALNSIIDTVLTSVKGMSS